MDRVEVARRVNTIKTKNERAYGWDDEGAHVDEDNLYRDLLNSIADGTCDDPRGCCIEAQRTQALDFARWCA